MKKELKKKNGLFLKVTLADLERTRYNYYLWGFMCSIPIMISSSLWYGSKYHPTVKLATLLLATIPFIYNSYLMELKISGAENKNGIKR